MEDSVRDVGSTAQDGLIHSATSGDHPLPTTISVELGSSSRFFQTEDAPSPLRCESLPEVAPAPIAPIGAGPYPRTLPPPSTRSSIVLGSVETPFTLRSGLRIAIFWALPVFGVALMAGGLATTGAHSIPLLACGSGLLLVFCT